MAGRARRLSEGVLADAPRGRRAQPRATASTGSAAPHHQSCKEQRSSRIRVVIGNVGPAMCLGDAQIGHQKSHRLGSHDLATVGMDSELPGGDLVFADGLFDELPGRARRSRCCRWRSHAWDCTEPRRTPWRGARAKSESAWHWELSAHSSLDGAARRPDARDHGAGDWCAGGAERVEIDWVSSFRSQTGRSGRLAAALAILLSAALVAGYLPARKASGTDPMAAVRHE